MEDHGYSNPTFDLCVFVKKFFDDDFIVLLLYVDDILIMGHDANKIEKLKKRPHKSFTMKHLGLVKHILAIRITHGRKKYKTLIILRGI